LIAILLTTTGGKVIKWLA